MKPYIHIDPEKCTGCLSCEMICSMKHFQAFNPHKARVKVVHYDYLGISCPVTCIQCSKPKCVAACPNEAITKLDNGLVRISAQKCNGCGSCVDGCIIGAINYDHDNHIALVCDLCGGEPACVQWCPTGALSLQDGGLDPKIKWDTIITQADLTERPAALEGAANVGGKEIDYSNKKVKKIIKKWGLTEGELDWYAQFGFAAQCRNQDDSASDAG